MRRPSPRRCAAASWNERAAAAGRGAPDGAPPHRRRPRADRGRGLRARAARPRRTASSSSSPCSGSTRSATLALAQRELTPAAHWMAIVDIAFAGALAYSSGGGFSQLRFAFLFPVVAVAFRGRPLVTASVAAASTVVYVLQAAPHPSGSSSGALSFVLVQAAYLAWLGFAMALLSLLLARRDAAVRMLSAQRQRLVAEALTAEERERRQLAQDLHDGAIQNLLAARHDLDVPARTAPDGPEARAHATITATVAELRGAVADLHPYLLEQAGLAAAIGQNARAAAARAGFELTLDLAEAAPGPERPCGAALHERAARERRAPRAGRERLGRARARRILRPRLRARRRRRLRSQAAPRRACARDTSASPRCASARRPSAARSRSRAGPAPGRSQPSRFREERPDARVAVIGDRVRCSCSHFRPEEHRPRIASATLGRAMPLTGSIRPLAGSPSGVKGFGRWCFHSLRRRVACARSSVSTGRPWASCSTGSRRSNCVLLLRPPRHRRSRLAPRLPSRRRSP